MKKLFSNLSGAHKMPATEFKDGLSDNFAQPKRQTANHVSSSSRQIPVGNFYNEGLGAMQTDAFQPMQAQTAFKSNSDAKQMPYGVAYHDNFSYAGQAAPDRGAKNGTNYVKQEKLNESFKRGTNMAKKTVQSFVQTEKIDLNLSGTENLLRQKHMHLGILLMIVAMLCFGLVMIFSASMNIGMYANNNPFFYINRQYVATLIGLFVMFVIANININEFNRAFLAFMYYIGTMGLLILVLIPRIGIFYNGQRRWLRIPFSGNTTFQPSEIAKVGVPFILAFYFSTVVKFREKGYFNLQSSFLQRWLDGFVDIALPTGVVLVLCLPISFQSHMSAVFIMLLLTFVLLLAMRLPWRSWFYGGSELLAMFLCLLLIVFMVKPLLGPSFTRRWDHLAKRLEIFRVQNQEDEKTQEKKVDVDTYHSDQAFIAIASGGLTGTGLGQGKQKLNYLPEGHNDYIFSNIVEELGFLGGCVVLGMFLVFFLIGCSIVTRTIGIFPRLISFGYLFLLTIQGVLSIAVNVGVIPPTGISMPFFSFGGTSNVFFLFAAGCILSVSKFAVRPSLAQKRQIAQAEGEIKQKFKDQGIRI